jgi:hypothetical protein
MTYSAKVIAASENESGQRLVTFEVTFPRFLLAEFNTHLIISKCSASSRAIPTEKILEIVKRTPFVPTFNKRVTGMGVGEELTPEQQEEAKAGWLRACNAAIEEAEQLLHVDKSRVNRMLEPYMWHTAILTATQWRNFFGLRCPDAEPVENFPAQMEFQTSAAMMRDAYIAATPRMLEASEWHLPYVTDEERDALDWKSVALLSAGRLARVSYANHEKDEPIDRSIDRAKGFSQSGHWSTMMHQGYAQWKPEWSGNFFGFAQFRKMFAYEADALSQRSVDWAHLIK